MTDEKRPKPDVNATIQLDQIDADQITFPDSQPAQRVVPPPLPPEVRAQALPVQQSVAPPKPTSGKTIALIGAFVVLLVLAIVGGLKVGSLAHGDAPAPSASVAAAPTPTPTPTPSASASSAAPIQTITIPTIEMR